MFWKRKSKDLNLNEIIGKIRTLKCNIYQTIYDYEAEKLSKKEFIKEYKKYNKQLRKLERLLS